MRGRATAGLAGVLTDLGYLLMAAFPRVHGIYRGWSRRRYARLASGYSQYVLNDADYLAPLTALLHDLPLSPRIIIDIGAGTGVATAALRRTFPQAVVIAVDASPAMLAHLEAGSRVRRVIADAFALPFCSGAADLLIAHNAPFHLHEMGRVAAPSAALGVILSSGAQIPGTVRRMLRRALHTGAHWRVEERRGGSGIAWIFHRSGVPTATAR